MKKLEKVFCAVILLLLLPGCENKMEIKTGMPQWSMARQYLPALHQLKCLDAKISIDENDDWSDWMLKENITGTWKLLLDFNAGSTIDYSCKSITYTFDANGMVTIESNVKEIPGGRFEYENYEDPFNAFGYPGNFSKPNLVIGENESYCQIADPWMVTFSVKYYGENSRFRGEAERIFYKIN
jgi:hypothetical protein